MAVTGGTVDMKTAVGFPFPQGCTVEGQTANFSVAVPEGQTCELIIYKKGARASAFSQEMPYSDVAGNLHFLSVVLEQPEDYEYCYKIGGKIVPDPYGKAFSGREHWSVSKGKEKRTLRTRIVTDTFDWGKSQFPHLKKEDVIAYSLHVRGFTKHSSSGVAHKGTFDGVTEKLPYFQKLGINQIHLMPVYEFDENQRHVNYWGYGKAYYFAPKASYCATKEPDREFRDMVHALHQAGIECIMEMYFPENTPSLQVVRSLWMWKLFYHVDGFHLMGDGVHQKVLEQDPILYGTKKMFSEIAGNADTENMLAEYNAGFKQDMRRFLKSDEGMISGAEFHVRRNTGSFGTINYMANQDGFTLYDTVAYNYRHNEANGEDNRDGSEFNYSWNCGIEGATRKQAIRKMREQQMRNAFLMLLLSQGTPMIYGGDEFANSQAGNNNAWCQDNAVGWTDWKNAKKQENLSTFVKEAIAFRKKHPILHMPQEMRGVDYMAKGFPDISVHGERAWFLNRDNTSRLLGVMYCGSYAENENGNADDFIYIGMNFHWEKRNIALPNLPDGLGWKKVADTSGQTPEQWFGEYEETYKKSIKINPRTIVVLIAKREESGHASMAALQDNNEA